MIRKNVDTMSTLHSYCYRPLHWARLYYIQHVNKFIYIHGCNNDVSGQSWGSAWKEMEFGRLPVTRETASASIIDGIARGGTTPEVMQAVAVPNVHITPRMSGQVKGDWK